MAIGVCPAPNLTEIVEHESKQDIRRRGMCKDAKWSMQNGTGQIDARDMLTRYGVRSPRLQQHFTNRKSPVIARLMRTYL